MAHLPEIAKAVVHDEGVARVRDWIANHLAGRDADAAAGAATGRIDEARRRRRATGFHDRGPPRRGHPVQPIEPAEWKRVAARLPAERACEVVAAHVLTTGLGRIWTAGHPRSAGSIRAEGASPLGGEAPVAVAAFTGGNLSLLGNPAAVPSGALAALLAELLEDWERVFIAADARFAARLRGEQPGLLGWPRVFYALPPDAPLRAPARVDGVTVRRLEPRDGAALEGLGGDIAWISDTHGGAAALAASGVAFGAWCGTRLASVVTSFYVGRSWEELGVVTEQAERGRGLSPLCAEALVREIRARGRGACWATTPDNVASQRVAEKLGFRRAGEAVHLLASREGVHTTGSIPLNPTD